MADERYGPDDVILLVTTRYRQHRDEPRNLLLTTLAGQDAVIPRVADWSLPSRALRAAPAWVSVASLALLAAAATPVSAGEWPNPRVASRATLTWTQTRPPYYVDQQTAFAPLWPNPDPVRAASHTWTQNLLQTTLASDARTVGSVVDALPQRRARVTLTWTQNLLESTLTPAEPYPFASGEWAIPRRSGRPTLIWSQDRPQFYQDIKPFLQTDWPLPGRTWAHPATRTIAWAPALALTSAPTTCIRRIPVEETFAWQRPILEIRSTPPMSPTKGERYIVDAGPTGPWTGREGDIAWMYDAGEWKFDTPADGWTAFNLDDGLIYLFVGSWGPLVSGGSGATLPIDLTTDVTGLLPIANIDITGTPDGTKFLRDDGSWTVPPGSGATGGLADLDATSQSVVNDASAQVLYSYAIPAGDLGASLLRLSLAGLWLNNTGGLASVRIQISLGGTVMYDDETGVIGTNAKSFPWRLNLLLANRGVASSQVVVGDVIVGALGIASPTAGLGPLDQSNSTASSLYGPAHVYGVAAEDSTAPLALEVTVMLSAADPNLSISRELVAVEMVEA